MIIGYARTSTVEQQAGLEAQERDLKAAGAEKLFKEQTSAVGQRKGLQEAFEFCREGDVLMVTKLDRLARSVPHLCELVAALEKKGVGLRVLNLGLDTSTPSGKLMLNVFGAVAQFEREMMLERQREGIAKAKREGRYKGRKPKARDQRQVISQMIKEGMTGPAIADRLGISLRSVRRYSGQPSQN